MPLVVKNPFAIAEEVRDRCSIPGLGRFPGERNGYKIVFWPAKFHGLCSPWDHKESDMTERLSLTYPEAFAYAKSPKFEC